MNTKKELKSYRKKKNKCRVHPISCVPVKSLSMLPLGTGSFLRDKLYTTEEMLTFLNLSCRTKLLLPRTFK